MTEHGPHHEVEELRHDLAFERATLDESIKHDYSTSDTGIVPLDKRRPMWHFAGLWTTFVAGFSYMFLGFEIHDSGHSLASTAAITLIGYGFYVAYAMTGSYLGSRTGQTHALLTRSIFGRVGSWIVSAFILVARLGWGGYQANLVGVLWVGCSGWGAMENGCVRVCTAVAAVGG
jgi:purine-cytosine permease-like protein